MRNIARRFGDWWVKVVASLGGVTQCKHLPTGANPAVQQSYHHYDTSQPEDSPSPVGVELTAALGEQRARLTRLCARLTGDADAAEDLAQETLLEAWRATHKLRDADGLAPWLSAIARNVCLRWARSRGAELAHRARPGAFADAAPYDTGDLDAFLAETLAMVGDEGDFTVELERQELATLLDRALALLPAETRLALVESAIHATPQAEIAARLGLSEGALRVRLSRGRLALRHALTTDLRDEADALGLRLPPREREDDATNGWQATRIWCPFCGRHTLEYHFHAAYGAISFRCVGRCQTDGTIIGGADGSPILASLAGLTSPKAILSRALLNLGDHYRRRASGTARFSASTAAFAPLSRFTAQNNRSRGSGDLSFPALHARRHTGVHLDRGGRATRVGVGRRRVSRTCLRGSRRDLH